MPTAAILLALVGATLLYAGARHQRLIATGGPRPLLRLAGGGVLAASLLLMLTGFGPAAALFVWATMAMLAWSIVPLAAAWWRSPPERGE